MKEKKIWKNPKLIKLKRKNGKVELNGKFLDLNDLLLEINTIRLNPGKNYFKCRENHL